MFSCYYSQNVVFSQNHSSTSGFHHPVNPHYQSFQFPQTRAKFTPNPYWYLENPAVCFFLWNSPLSSFIIQNIRKITRVDINRIKKLYNFMTTLAPHQQHIRGLKKNLWNFKICYLTLRNSRQNKSSPLEILENCVTPVGNSKAKIQDPMKLHIIFSWSLLKIPSNTLLINPWNFRFLFLQHPWNTPFQFQLCRFLFGKMQFCGGR